MRKRFRSKLYYQYLLSYVVILSIPLLVIGLFVYNHFLQTLRNEVVHSNLNILSQVKEIVDVKFGELEKIAYQISRNPDLTPYMATRNAVQGMNTIQELRNYTAGNSFIGEMMLHYRGQPYVYSSVSTYAVADMLTTAYPFEHWSPEQFRSDLETLSAPLLRPAEQVGSGERMITYLVPIPFREASPYATVLFLVRNASIINLIQSVLHDYGGGAYIYDREGRLVTAWEEDETEPAATRAAELMAVIDPAARSGSRTVTFGERDYFVSYVTSAETGWVYAARVDKERAMASVVRIKQFALAGLAAAVGIGGLFIYGLMQLNYKPIRRLRQWTEALTGDSDNGRSGGSSDELDAIRSAVSRLSADSRELGKTIAKTKPAVKHYVLTSLFNGRIRDRKEFNRQGEAGSVSFDRSYGVAAVCLLTPDRPEHTPSRAEREALIDRFESVCRAYPGIDCYGVDGIDSDRLLLLIGMDEDDGSRLRAPLRQLLAEAKTLSGCKATIGVGVARADLADIGKSYLEASTALDYRLIKGTDQVIAFAEAARTSVHWHSDQALSELELALKLGDMDRIRACLDTISASICHPDTSLFTARFLCYDLIHTVIRPVYEIGAATGEGSELLPDVASLLKFDTAAELADMVRSISGDICQFIRSQKESRNYALKDELMAYIERHFADYDFSLQTMAESFSLSAPYVSRYFKDQTGLTVSQYVHRVRITAAKRMLEAGEQNLSELVQQIGYVNTSSFIRKFKETEGMTPGEYRRAYAKNGI